MLITSKDTTIHQISKLNILYNLYDVQKDITNLVSMAFRINKQNQPQRQTIAASLICLEPALTLYACFLAGGHQRKRPVTAL